MLIKQEENTMSNSNKEQVRNSEFKKLGKWAKMSKAIDNLLDAILGGTNTVANVVLDASDVVDNTSATAKEYIDGELLGWRMDAIKSTNDAVHKYQKEKKSIAQMKEENDATFKALNLRGKNK
jgi:hypothetical protein